MEKIKRNVLLNPGPATTTDTVKYAQVVPDICPREKEFAGMMKQLRSDLLKVAHAPEEKYTSVLFCGSGTINIDICLNSLLPAGKKVFVVNNGAYSSRAVEVCQYYGLPHLDLKSSVFERPDLAAVKKTLDENPDVAVVYTTHHETGTGILNPIREIGALAHQHGAIFVVDTTSSLGMIPFDMEQDNVDFCMASAQKGLMAMAGLSFGGGQSWSIGLKHPEVFSSIGIFSSGMFGGVGPGAYAPFSVESQLPELLADPAAFNAAHDVFYMSCGLGDPRIEHTRKAAEALKAAGAKVHFSAWPGGHEWQPWRKSLHEFV